MGLDKANIFKPNDNELTKYPNDPFLDCFESTKVFAKALKNDIDTKIISIKSSDRFRAAEASRNQK